MNAGPNLTLDLDRHAHQRPGEPLLLGTGTPIPYAWVSVLAWRCAQLLYDLGVRRGDVVALTVLDPRACAVALLAVARLGATNLPLPASSGPEERRELASRAGARRLLTDRPARFDTGLETIRIDLSEIRDAGIRIDPEILDPRPEAPWQIVRGSGSTGAPKLLPVTHAQARARAQAQVESYGVTSDDCLGSLSGFDFNTGRQVLLRAIHAGASCAILQAPGENAATLAVRLGVTQVGLSVFHAERLLASGEAATLASSTRLRAVLIGGSPVSSDLRTRLRAVIGDRLWVLYGTNEASILTISRPPEVFETEGTVGRPMPGVRIEIVDRDDNPLPIGEVGLVRVANPRGIERYADDDDATRRDFREGWFHPGDLGRLTDTGELVFYGRADHMMIFNGINIYPAEIERAMQRHPAVADVAVVPWRSNVHHDIPVAAIALRPGAEADPEALLAHARAHLGGRSPARVLIVDTVPRNEQGKLVRAELSTMLSAKPA